MAADELGVALNFSVTQLRAFVAVAKTLSYPSAANLLGYTEPAVHHQVKRLEGLLECRLFEKSGRGLKISLAGERLLPRAVRILNESELMARAASDVRQADSIAVAGGRVISAYRLPSVFAAFERKERLMRISLQTGTPAEVVSQVESCEVDIGISHGIEQLVNPSETSLVPWVEDHFYLFSTTGANIMDSSIVYSVTQMGRPLATLLRCFRKAGINEPRIEFLSSADAVKNLTVAGLGLGFLPSSCVSLEAQAGLLQTIELPGTPIASRAWIALPRDREISPIVQRFLGFLSNLSDRRLVAAIA